jgi:hypothetical protein
MNVRVTDRGDLVFSLWLPKWTHGDIDATRIISGTIERRWNAKIREWFWARTMKVMVDGVDEFDREICQPAYVSLSDSDWEMVSTWWTDRHWRFCR